MVSLRFCVRGGTNSTFSSKFLKYLMDLRLRICWLIWVRGINIESLFHSHFNGCHRMVYLSIQKARRRVAEIEIVSRSEEFYFSNSLDEI